MVTIRFMYFPFSVTFLFGAAYRQVTPLNSTRRTCPLPKSVLWGVKWVLRRLLSKGGASGGPQWTKIPPDLRQQSLRADITQRQSVRPSDVRVQQLRGVGA